MKIVKHHEYWRLFNQSIIKMMSTSKHYLPAHQLSERVLLTPYVKVADNEFIEAHASSYTDYFINLTSEDEGVNHLFQLFSESVELNELEWKWFEKTYVEVSVETVTHYILSTRIEQVIKSFLQRSTIN